MGFFAKTIKDLQPVTKFAKISILDFQLGSEYNLRKAFHFFLLVLEESGADFQETMNIY